MMKLKNFLNNNNVNFKKLNDNDLYQIVSEEIINGKAIGWFQGRMEFGPRALGNRSIIADARSEKMQRNLNLKVKFREKFQTICANSVRGKDKKNILI